MATKIAAQGVIDENEKTEFTLEEDTELLKTLNGKKYKEQAIWFLNAFWKQVFAEKLDDAEKIWEYHNLCVELDPKKEDGNELDELKAHILLEKTEGALTVRELREKLKTIDLDFNKFVSLTEFLVTKYDVDWRQLVHAPQGQMDEAKLALAQQKVEDAKRDIADCESRAAEAKASEKESLSKEKAAKKDEEDAVNAKAEAKKSEENAKGSEEAAKERETEAFQEEESAKKAETQCEKAAAEQLEAEKQVKTALEEVTREEQAFLGECARLEQIGNDGSLGIVARNKAKAELAQLKQMDPIPLQRAKISQEAVVRRQEKTVQRAEAAKFASKSARTQAEKAREAAVESREVAEHASKTATEHRCEAESTAVKAKDARELAEKAREEAELARDEANAALQKSTESFQAATRYLQKVKKECAGAGKGKLWWLDRELTEAKKYMSPAQLARLEAAPPMNEDIVPVSA